MKRILLLLFILSSSLGGMADPAYSTKPRTPIYLKITPVGEIVPGSVQEITVEAYSMMAAEEMTVEVRLTGQAEYISGELGWNGPAGEGEVVSLHISVRIPEKGHGQVNARAVIAPSKSTRFSASDRLHLPSKEKKIPPVPPLKRDGRGRVIIEHRL